jgi:3-deoxy-D-manno-octulosonate 8-phosphate phosphatase KdsC-like HAD superfamily phosphatase
LPSCGYIGDDLPDLPVLREAGFAATVADARDEVKAVAHWVTLQPGGRGAVRALAEFVLRSKGRRVSGNGARLMSTMILQEPALPCVTASPDSLPSCC